MTNLIADIESHIAEVACGRECIFDADFVAVAVAAGEVGVHWDEDESAWLLRSLNGTPVAAIYTDGAYINGNQIEA
jgi:hypothetical protein